MPDSQPLLFSADSIVDTVREPMLVLSADLRVRRANRSFYRTFKVTPEETVDRLVYDLGNQQWDIPWLRKLLEEVLPQNTAFDDFEVEQVFPAIGRKYMLLNARRICGKDNQTEFILLAIKARSEGLGRGSGFLVRLPVFAQPPQEQPVAAGDNEKVVAAPKRRILVVDDNRDSAISLSMMLSLMGNETRTAHDGLEAVETAATFQPDVILLDIGLPKLNGYDACRRIRENPCGKGMVIVALTGWGQEEDKRRSSEAGFNHHMVKPVDPAALEALLAGLESPLRRHLRGAGRLHSATAEP